MHGPKAPYPLSIMIINGDWEPQVHRIREGLGTTGPQDHGTTVPQYHGTMGEIGPGTIRSRSYQNLWRVLVGYTRITMS